MQMVLVKEWLSNRPMWKLCRYAAPAREPQVAIGLLDQAGASAEQNAENWNANTFLPRNSS
jgi:hypothetical protein